MMAPRPVYLLRVLGPLLAVLLLLFLLPGTRAIFCYKCESYRDYRCLDPFDYRPHVQVNCDYEPFVRDRKPVFCEKLTELIDGVYVTTRSCSSFDWETVGHVYDYRNQHMRCFRNGLLERCLCDTNSCNAATPSRGAAPPPLWLWATLTSLTGLLVRMTSMTRVLMT